MNMWQRMAGWHKTWDRWGSQQCFTGLSSKNCNLNLSGTGFFSSIHTVCITFSCSKQDPGCIQTLTVGHILELPPLRSLWESLLGSHNPLLDSIGSATGLGILCKEAIPNSGAHEAKFRFRFLKTKNKTRQRPSFRNAKNSLKMISKETR